MSAAEKVPKPENLLKLKGRTCDFSPPKPDNILKIKQLKMNMKKGSMGCKLSDGGDAKLSLADGRKSPV